MALLDHSLKSGHRLSFILAPAGFGKTTLAIDWISQCNMPFAWLSLDAEDQKVSYFLSYVVAALQTINEGIGQSLSKNLMTSPPIESVLTALVNEIADLPQRFILVLDDFHLAESKEVHEALNFLVKHLPSQMHLLIISRKELDLPIARLRALNQVTEIGAKDLLLNDVETELFLSSTMGLELPSDNVARLKTSTEGWVAGLQLAAISIREQENLDRFVNSLTGANQLVFDFLFEEVFTQQPESIQTFLIGTANLNRMNSALCDFVLSDLRLHSAEALDYLQRVNLFLVRLDEAQAWFRYHHLFHDSLRLLQARYLDEKTITNFHLRASTWFENNGDVQDAFQHAIAAKNSERVAQLAEKSWEVFSQKFKFSTWLEWVKTISEDVIIKRPVLCVQIARALIDEGSFDRSEERLRDAESCIQDRSSEMCIEVSAQFQNLPARIAFVRAYNAQNRGDIAETIRYAQLVLHLSSIEEDHLIRAQARAILAAACWARGDVDQAYHSLVEWVEYAKQHDNAFFAIATSAAIAQILISQGHLSDALRVHHQALKDAKELEGGAQEIIAHHFLGLALLNHQRGNTDMAMDYLRQSGEAGAFSTMPDWQYRYHIALARFSDSQENYESALGHLEEAERHFVATLFPELQPLEALRAALYIKQGALQRAQTWVKKSRLSMLDEATYLREFSHLTMVRVRLAETQNQIDVTVRGSLLDFLDRLLAKAEEQNRLRSVLDILKLKAQIHFFNGNQLEAFNLIERILTHAQPEGMLRFFVDDGQAMYAMLAAFRAKLMDNMKLRGRYAAYLDKVLSSFPNQLAAPLESILEPLSQRELTVLKLIAEGHSNEEICAQLFLALDTVKGHNRRIFNKLQVHRRTEAVIRAQKLGLL